MFWMIYYHQLHYNKKMNIFDGWALDGDLQQDNHSCHGVYSLGRVINTFIQETQKMKNVEEEKKDIESKEEETNEARAEDLEIGNHSYHDSVSLGVTLDQFLQKTGEKKEIEAEIEIDEMNEFENILNELQSINNEMN